MRVLHVASEVAPWSQTGGLADVIGALPRALAQVGGDDLASTVSPLYRGIRERAADRGATLSDTGVSVAVPIGEETITGRFWVLRCEDSPPVFLLDCPHYYDRDGLYGGYGDTDYPDNAQRFAFLSRAAVMAGEQLLGGRPDIYHAHDWQASLVPVYLATARSRLQSPGAALSIHNLAYQGIFAKELVPILGLDWAVFTMQRMELHDMLCLLKGGIAYADAITTVSPTYADEIRTPAHGFRLDGFLRHHAPSLAGILNGIDTEVWDPATDDEIPARFDSENMDGKAICRAALLHETGLPASPSDLVIGVVARLTHQKGMDLVAEIIPVASQLGARIVLLGSGSRALEDRFRWLGSAFSHHLSVHIGFDVGFSRRIYAGADAVLVPSRFEPCGLSQMYGMRYGSLPIANGVGGLRDTVADPDFGTTAETGSATGYRFDHATVHGIRWAIGRAARRFREDPKGWKLLVHNAMNRDWSWQRSAREYLRVYRQIAPSGRKIQIAP